MNRFRTVLTIEGLLLTIAGLIHIIYLILFVDLSSTDPAAYGGALFFGVAYALFGLSFLANKTRLILPALVINAVGLTSVLIAQEQSPLWEVDPFLMAIDLVSIPLLIYLLISSRKAVLN